MRRIIGCDFYKSITYVLPELSRFGALVGAQHKWYGDQVANQEQCQYTEACAQFT